MSLYRNFHFVGCTVGCDVCDGTTNHVGHGNQRWLYKGMSQAVVTKKKIVIPDPFNPPLGDMVLDPKTFPGLNITPGCAKPNGNKATVCASSLRTGNTKAKCGSAEDYYFYSPWRYPGSAPMIDSCGMAGGRFPGQSTGGAGAQYQNTSLAKEGDMGSKLPAMASQATWKAGSSYEVGWTGEWTVSLAIIPVQFLTLSNFVNISRSQPWRGVRLQAGTRRRASD
jgi:hypothetical protein